MQYQGGKAKIARPLAAVILAHRSGQTTYIEPFLGGASVFSLVAPSFPVALAGDVHPDLVLLWQAVLDGWDPPKDLSESEWRWLKAVPEASPIRGFAGFACSFGGRWFEGYARSSKCPNFAARGRRRILEKARGMTHAEIRLARYEEWEDRIGPEVMVYADPPYEGTKPLAADLGSPADFWETMERWVGQGALVLVSGYEAPEGWSEVWGIDTQARLSLGDKTRLARERLFVLDGLE